MESISERVLIDARGVGIEAMLLESISEAVFALDGAWRFRYVNHRAAEMLQRPVEDLVGRVVWDAMPDAVGSDLHHALQPVMDEHRRASGETYSRIVRGWVQYDAYPTDDGIVLLLRDITARHRAEHAAQLLADAGVLLASSLDMHETLDHLAAIVVPRLASVCVVDLVQDGELERVVTRAEAAEYERELRELRERVPIASLPTHPVHGVVATGEAFLATPITPEIVQAAGGAQHAAALQRVGWTSIMILPLIARGRTVGAMSLGTLGDRRMFDDEDQRLARELALRAAIAVDTARLFAEAQAMRAEAEAANHAKAEFLATISHELRTPLTAIRGFTELVLEGVGGPLSGEQEDHLRRVSAASDHLLVLVDEVLGFARLQAGRAEVRVRPCTLDEVVDSALNLVRPMLDRKALVLERRTPPGDFRLLTDVDKLRQILANLLSNAVKFTERGSVTLEGTGDANSVRLTVRDTGPGIAASALDSIFEPFRQVDQSLTRRVGGAGLGLAVARRLAELLGGSLAVESTVGAGSAFTVRLPRRYHPPCA